MRKFNYRNGGNKMFNPYQNLGQNNMPQGMYNAFNQPYNAFNQQTQQLVRVNGIEGARAYQMSANSTVALFDNNEDVMYIKATDGAGFPTIRTFVFTEQVGNTVPQSNEYVTRKELEDYVKQFIQPEITDKQVSD